MDLTLPTWREPGDPPFLYLGFFTKVSDGQLVLADVGIALWVVGTTIISLTFLLLFRSSGRLKSSNDDGVEYSNGKGVDRPRGPKSRTAFFAVYSSAIFATFTAGIVAVTQSSTVSVCAPPRQPLLRALA